MEYIPQKDYDFILERVPILCVDLFIRFDGKILLVKRNNQPAKDQFWFPGGRVRKNEKISDAAVRIALAETNLSCAFEKRVCVEEAIFEKMDTMPCDVHTVTVCCELDTKAVDSLKLDRFHTGFIWVDRIIENLHPAVERPLEILGLPHC